MIEGPACQTSPTLLKCLWARSPAAIGGIRKKTHWIQEVNTFQLLIQFLCAINLLLATFHQKVLVWPLSLWFYPLHWVVMIYFNIKSKVMKIFLVFVRQVACTQVRGIVLERTAPGGYDNWSIVELVAIEDSFDIRKILDKCVICLRSGRCGLGEMKSSVSGSQMF